MFRKLMILCGLFTALVSQVVSANLLISPTRIAFDERQRSAKVTVINNSDESRTYRIVWSEKQALAQGGYNTVADLLPTSLSPMTRLSPKQVRLAPGEKQTIKIAIRKPKGLAAGEYRSHLLFQALPNEDKNPSAGIKINMIMSFSIPIVYREQAKQPEVQITAANVVLGGGTMADQIKVQLKESTGFSSYGRLSAFTKTKAGELDKIAEIGNLSLYPEVEEAKVTLKLFADKKLPKSGNVVLKYQGAQEYQDTEFASYVIALD